MSLVLNEDQRIIKDSAREFLSAKASIDLFRELRQQGAEKNYSDANWQQMIDLGWSAMTIKEQFNGHDLGYANLGQIFEEKGKNFSASPLFSNLVLSASALDLIATEQQKEKYLPQIAQGKLLVTLAFEEGTHHQNLEKTQSLATYQGEHYFLSGHKRCVLNAQQADKILVVAKVKNENNENNNALSLFLLDPKQSNVKLNKITLLDGSQACDITFKNAQVEALIGALGSAQKPLEQVFDHGRAILAAEMLGASLTMFSRTIEFLKEREQFGVKIGSFQALKHRAAHMFVQLELAKSVVLAALNAIDNNAPQRGELCALAKATLNETFVLVTDEATQMHGGMGVTDELDVGLFLKRARVYKQLLGDTHFLRDHYAQLQAF